MVADLTFNNLFAQRKELVIQCYEILSSSAE